MKMMKRKPAKRIKDRHGATAIEFAIILPLLIVLLFGTIELGLYLYNKQVITNACREGARAGIVVRLPRLTNDEIESVVEKYCKDHLVTFGVGEPHVILKEVNNDPYTFDSDTNRCTTFGCDLEVRVDYLYDFLVLSNLGFGQKKITSVSVMKME
jgi:Flp pilus assembly protein TadG